MNAVGTAALVRSIVRRDRFRIAIWTIGMIAMLVFSADSVRSVFPTEADLVAAAESSRNPAVLAFQGPDQGLDTLGGQVAFQIGAPGLVFMAVMALLLIGHMTRAEEDAGRLELVRSLPVGRNAPLLAAGVVVGVMSIVIGVATTLAMLAFDLPVAGSIDFGLGYAATGLVFAAVTLVCAQVTDNPRLANGLAGVAVGAAFVLRAIGDMRAAALSWMSPLGWVQRARPYAGERWWPLALTLVVAAGLTLVAIELQGRRDLDAGLIAPRPGRATAAPSLSTPLALAVRLQRGAVIGWTAGTAFMAFVYGAMTNAIEQFVEDNPDLADFFQTTGSSLTESYLATAARISVLVGSGFAVQSILRLRSEETNERTEPVLATPVSRWSYWAADLAVAVVGSIVVLTVSGIVLGVSAAVAAGDAGLVWPSTWAMLVHLPAVLVMIGVGALLIGIAPRIAQAAWATLVAAFVVAMFGPILDLPSWVMRVSPFENLARVPAEPLTPGPVAALAAIAVAMLGAGLASYRRRDVPT